MLTGTGERAFSTGADLDEQHAFLRHAEGYWEWMGHFIAAVDAVRHCPRPTVARLNGMTVAGGNELNLACDLAVAADDVVFRHVGPSRGSVPAGGATQWLPLIIGDRRAREVLLLNQPISARHALEWGWVNRVVPRVHLDAAVDEICRELLAKMPQIVRATKVQLDFWRDLAWSSTIRHAREWLTLHADSEEVAEGLRSFDEKRPPDYERLRARSGRDEHRTPEQGTPEQGTPVACPACGRAVPPGMLYCGFCGARVEPPAPPTEASQAEEEIHDV